MSKLNNRIVLIGLGSPIMCDDAIGLKVSEQIEAMGFEDVDTLQEAVGGLDIIPMVRGYSYAIIVDAIQTKSYEPGTIMFFDPEDFESTVVEASAHDVNLATALKLGKQMDAETMPLGVKYIAIEVADIQTVTEEMTPVIEETVPKAVNAAIFQIEEFRSLIG